jgi:hypothetical protein
MDVSYRKEDRSASRCIVTHDKKGGGLVTKVDRPTEPNP